MTIKLKLRRRRCLFLVSHLKSMNRLISGTLPEGSERRPAAARGGGRFLLPGRAPRVKRRAAQTGTVRRGSYDTSVVVCSTSTRIIPWAPTQIFFWSAQKTISVRESSFLRKIINNRACSRVVQPTSNASPCFFRFSFFFVLLVFAKTLFLCFPVSLFLFCFLVSFFGINLLFLVLICSFWRWSCPCPRFHRASA